MEFNLTSEDSNQPILNLIEEILKGNLSKEDAVKHIRDVEYSWYNTGREDEREAIYTASLPPLYTPENIISLKPHEYVFVGTNPEGRHGAGFAKKCHDDFFLEYGKAKGLSGQCYGIITKDLQAPNYGMRSIPLDVIQRQILTAYDFIKKRMHPGTVWYMTKIATNLAGYTEAELNKILQDIKQYQPKNVILPILN